MQTNKPNKLKQFFQKFNVLLFLLCVLLALLFWSAVQYRAAKEAAEPASAALTAYAAEEHSFASFHI